jgi:hypothetical protein
LLGEPDFFLGDVGEPGDRRQCGGSRGGGEAIVR